MKQVHVVFWACCDSGGYNRDDGILSIHETPEGAKIAEDKYNSSQYDNDNDWAYTEIREVRQ